MSAILTDEQIQAAVSAMPAWLAVDVADWINGAQERGERFADPATACAEALTILADLADPS